MRTLAVQNSDELIYMVSICMQWL